MELILEIIIYLLVVLGLITVCFTFFNKFNLIDTTIERDTKDNTLKEVTYSRNKTEDSKIVINIRYKNISVDEIEKIKSAIEIGNYDSITDIADEINYIDSSKKSKKK